MDSATDDVTHTQATLSSECDLINGYSFATDSPTPEGVVGGQADPAMPIGGSIFGNFSAPVIVLVRCLHFELRQLSCVIGIHDVAGVKARPSVRSNNMLLGCSCFLPALP
jgi:hypothetical protein